MSENPTSSDASEEAITAKDVFDYVVKQVEDKPVILFVGGLTLLLVGRKILKSSKSTKDVEKLSLDTLRLYAGPFGTDTVELSVMLKGEELRQAMSKVGLTVVKK